MIGLNGCFSFLVHLMMKYPILAVMIIAVSVADINTHLLYDLTRKNVRLEARETRLPVPIPDVERVANDQAIRNLTARMANFLNMETRRNRQELMDWVNVKDNGQETQIARTKNSL